MSSKDQGLAIIRRQGGARSLSVLLTHAENLFPNYLIK